jgi:hypothetical protein
MSACAAPAPLETVSVLLLDRSDLPKPTVMTKVMTFHGPALAPTRVASQYGVPPRHFADFSPAGTVILPLFFGQSHLLRFQVLDWRNWLQFRLKHWILFNGSAPLLWSSRCG